MAFTDHSDVYGALHEEGINRVVRHLMRQRPSLFNYGTAAIAANPELMCQPPDVADEVTAAGNPIITVMSPLPIIGAPVPLALDYSFQLTHFEIDFHPGNTIALPPQLTPPLPEQRFALRLRACAGLGCPPDDLMGQLVPAVETLTDPIYGERMAAARQRQPPIVLPTRRLRCFCLDLFGVGYFELGTVGSSPHRWLKARLGGLEIVDIRPTELENAMECYMALVLRLGILPRMRVAMESLVFEIMGLIKLLPTPISPALPFNPAVEDDQVKVFMNLEVI
jgi:hypothetical protein